jgi:hypothetical protein
MTSNLDVLAALRPVLRVSYLRIMNRFGITFEEQSRSGSVNPVVVGIEL